MNFKQKYGVLTSRFVFSLMAAISAAVFALVSFFIFTNVASAAPDSGGGAGGTVRAGQNCTTTEDGSYYCVDPALDCSPDAIGPDSCNLFVKYINPITIFLSAFVGIAVTIGIISGAIKYSMAGSEPAQVAAARKQIRNSLIALIAFLFLAAIINWLVPGGVI